MPYSADDIKKMRNSASEQSSVRETSNGFTADDISKLRGNKASQLSPKLGMGDLKKYDYEPDNVGIGEATGLGFLTGVNESNKTLISVPKLLYKPFSALTDLLTPDWLYDPKKDATLNALDKGINYYDELSSENEKKVANSGIGAKVAYNVSSIVPQAITTAVTGKVPLPKVGTVGGLFNRFTQPVANATSKVLPNALNPVAKNLLPTMVKEGAENALVGAGLDIASERDAGTMARNAAVNFGVGAGLGGLLNVKNARSRASVNAVNPPPPNNPTGNTFNPAESPVQRIATGTNRRNFSVRQAFDRFYNRISDTNNPIRMAGDTAYVKATNSANVGNTVENILKTDLTNRQGNSIGDSLKKVLEDNVPRGQEIDFWEYALQRHNMGRSAQNSPIYWKADGTPYTPQESLLRTQYLENQHPDWQQRARNVSKWIDDFIKEWGVGSGTVDNNLYTQLRTMYPDYIPSNRSFTDLEDFIPRGSGNGRGFVDQTVPLRQATGSERNIIDPTENIMHLVNRTVRTAKYNEVGQEVLNAVRNNPNMANVARIVQGPNANVDNVVRVLENGQPVYIEILNEDLLGALSRLTRTDVGDIEAAAKKLTGAFKALITTKNPVFAIRNIARDLPTYFINSKETNPLRLVGNLGSAAKELFGESVINPLLARTPINARINTSNLRQYNALGGEGSQFLNSRKMTKSASELTGRVPITNANNEILRYRNTNPLKKGLSKIGGAIETFNNITEKAPRLAEFKNTLARGGSLDQAMFDAADVTTNFSRGGSLTKRVDSFVPYLNAGVQGLDKLARSLNPMHPRTALATLIKGGLAVSAPVMYFHYLNYDNPNYQQLDNRTKDNYILIPNAFGDKDDKGYATTFIKIPKSREYGVLFGSLFERLNRQNKGEKEAFKNFGGTVATNFAPANPIENNILSPLAYNIPKNRDFANRAIVPENMKDRSPELQYDEQTSEIAKKIGELTDLSPKQLDYIIRSYTGVIGQMGIPATTKANYLKGNVFEKSTKPITSQFIADPLYSNQSMTNFYDNLDKLKTKAVDKNFIENIPSKKVTPEEKIRNEFTKASTSISNFSKKLKEADQLGNIDKVKELRQNMINITNVANKLLETKDVNEQSKLRRELNKLNNLSKKK